MATTLSALVGKATAQNWRYIRVTAARILADQGWGTTGSTSREWFGLAGLVREVGAASDKGYEVDNAYCARVVNERIAHALAFTGGKANA